MARRYFSLRDSDGRTSLRLAARHLRKSFTKTEVLRSVSLEVGPGEALALLGQNGAGKTTLLKVLAGLIEADGGEVELLPWRSASAGHVGFASGEERSLHLRLTARQNLEFYAALHGLDPAERAARIRDLARRLDLAGFLDRRLDRCSSGMRARVGLARALLHDPPVLLLDEPTKSLDPDHAAAVRALIRERSAAGRITIFATHSALDASESATRVLELRNGLVFELSRKTPEQRPTGASEPNASDPPRRFGLDALRRALAFLRRDAIEQFSYRASLAFETASIAAVTLMFFFLGQFVERLAPGGLSRGGYFGFALSGIAFSSLLAQSLHGFAERIRTAQLAGTLEGLFLTPARSAEIAVWGSAWSFAYQSAKVALFLLAGALLGLPLERSNWPAVVAALVLGVAALAPLGILAAAAVLLWKRAEPVSQLLATASTLLAGVYYPVEILPGWLERLAQAIPLTHAVGAFRAALLDGAPVRAIGGQLLLLAAFAVSLGPLSLAAFSVSVRHCRRRGTLGQF